MRAVLPAPDEGGAPRLGEVESPRPGADEVLLRVHAAGLNRADLLQLRGLYPPPPGVTEVPGLECAGEVLEVGSAVESWRPGDRVMALLAGGGHAEQVAVPGGQLLRLPARLSFVEGAAVPEAALTAWANLVVEGELREGETVLVTGATGGVGSFTVQLARELGARVLAAGRDPERLARLGADAALVDDEALPAAAREATGGAGTDLVLDLVAGSLLGPHLEALRPGGRLVLVGLMGGGRATIDLGALMRRRLRIVGSVLRSREVEEKGRLVAGFSEFGGPRLADGRLRPVVARVVPFARAAEAYAALAAGGHLGKIVVEMEPT